MDLRTRAAIMAFQRVVSAEKDLARRRVTLDRAVVLVPRDEMAAYVAETTRLDQQADGVIARIEAQGVA